jgi:IS605 OrfB family transposase
MKQFHLEENNYSKHEEWKKDWQDARNSSFAFIGSKDESYGNQTCQYKNDNDLVIKVPDYLVSKYGAFVTIKNVKFYKLAQKQLDWARKTYMGETKGGRAQKYCNSSISYTFTKQDGKWFIIATVTIELPNTKTSSHYGTLGVDLNAGFLSVCEVDRFGNYLNDKDIIIKMYDRTHNQVKASIGDAVKELVEWALRTKKSICIEDLDFAKLKASLTEKSKKYARMLSGLTYVTFKEMLFSKAQKCGVEVILVNPAFTSVTGHFKFMRKYGLSSHASAAMTIARRGMSFKRMEKPVINPDLNGLSPRSDKFKKSSYKIKGAVVSGENRVNGKEKKRQLVIKPQICKKQEETHKTRRQKWQKILNNCKEINFNERIEILKLV